MCWCVNVEIGSYDNQVVLWVPTDMKGKIGKDNIAVDACLAVEIFRLWQHGVATLGCCCGHNSAKEPYIQVARGYNRKMKVLGYKNTPKQKPPNDQPGCYVPKTLAIPEVLIVLGDELVYIHGISTDTESGYTAGEITEEITSTSKNAMRLIESLFKNVIRVWANQSMCMTKRRKKGKA